MRILLHASSIDSRSDVVRRLARTLRSHDHEVWLTASGDTPDRLDADRFLSLRIHEPFDLGSLSGLADEDRVELSERIADDYFSGAVSAAVHALEPDLIIADRAASSPLSFVAHELGIPCLQLCASFSERIDALPPINCALLPSASRLELEGARWRASCL